MTQTLIPARTPEPADPAKAACRARAVPASADALLEDEALLSAILGRAGALRDGLAGRLLAAFDGLGGVVAADPCALLRIGGVDDGAVAELKRAWALAVRLARDEAHRRPIVSSSAALLAYVRVALSSQPREQFRVLYLDGRNRLLRDEWIADGTVNHAPVYPREVVRRALELSAQSFILVHNHPSGDPAPSQADIAMTRQIVAAARVFDLQVHDHLVVGREGTASLRALGLM